MGAALHDDGTPSRHWTAALYTRANPLMRRVLTSRFHRPMSRRAVLLGVTGRHTGRQYEICVGYSACGSDGIDVLVSDAANRTWWRNFTDGGPVRVVLRGERRTGWAVAHRAPTDGFKAVADRAIPGIVGVRGAQRFLGIADFDPDVGLGPEDLAWLDGFAVAVAIELDPD